MATMSQATMRGDDTAGCRAALALARIDTWSGDAAAALSAAEGCVDTLAAHASPSEATMARAIGAIAALRVGDRARARTLLDGLGGRTAREEDFVARATTEIALARWRGTGTSKLMQLATSSSDASMRLVELDALLAAADIAALAGDGPTRASALERAEALARRRELVAYTRLVDAARAAGP